MREEEEEEEEACDLGEEMDGIIPLYMNCFERAFFFLLLFFFFLFSFFVVYISKGSYRPCPSPVPILALNTFFSFFVTRCACTQFRAKPVI